MDRIKDEDIRGTAHGKCFGHTVKPKRWFGQVKRYNVEAATLRQEA